MFKLSKKRLDFFYIFITERKYNIHETSENFENKVFLIS